MSISNPLEAIWTSLPVPAVVLNSQDLIGLVELLISDKAKKITGQNIIIDDGFSL